MAWDLVWRLELKHSLRRIVSKGLHACGYTNSCNRAQSRHRRRRMFHITSHGHGPFGSKVNSK